MNTLREFLLNYKVDCPDGEHKIRPEDVDQIIKAITDRLPEKAVGESEGNETGIPQPMAVGFNTCLLEVYDILGEKKEECRCKPYIGDVFISDIPHCPLHSKSEEEHLHRFVYNKRRMGYVCECGEIMGEEKPQLPEKIELAVNDHVFSIDGRTSWQSQNEHFAKKFNQLIDFLAKEKKS